MIYLKNDEQLALMREPCKILRDALKLAGEHVKPGITTAPLDKIVYDYITSQDDYPSVLNS